MGLSGCYGVIKYLMVLINFVFWLVGATVVAFAAWMILDPTFYFSMTEDETNYKISVYIFLAAGALMIIVAFLGCCGAFKESQCMLISFFSFLLVILVAEVAAGVWAYTKSHDLEIKIRNAVKNTVQEEYHVVQSRTQTFDVIQQQLQCCGANGPRDWAGSAYNKEGKSGFMQSVSAITQVYKIPKSCCRVDTDSEICAEATELGIGATIAQVIYSQGCVDKLIDVIKSHMNIVTGITIGVIAIEVLGIIFSLVLCFAINRSDRYKA